MNTAITSQPNYYQVTEAQLAACTRLVATNGDIYFECNSAHEEGVYYTLTYRRAYKLPQCNCAAGRDGTSCWHQRAALQLEAIERDAQAAEQIAATREAKAVARDGARAYTRKEFSLLK